MWKSMKSTFQASGTSSCKRFVGKCPLVILLYVLQCISLASQAGDPAPPVLFRVESNSPTPRLRVLAMRLEDQGQLAEAAAIYELLCSRSELDRRLASERLVWLNLRLGRTNEVRRWAAEAARSRPFPELYLAFVEAQLGHSGESASILKKALSAARTAEKQCLVLWQLAELYEKSGQVERAESLLWKAIECAPNQHMKELSWRRLCHQLALRGQLAAALAEWKIRARTERTQIDFLQGIAIARSILGGTADENDQ